MKLLMNLNWLCTCSVQQQTYKHADDLYILNMDGGISGVVEKVSTVQG